MRNISKALGLALALLVPALAMAALTKFERGTVISAEEMNGNFEYLAAQLQANSERLQALEDRPRAQVFQAQSDEDRPMALPSEGSGCRQLSVTVDIPANATGSVMVWAEAAVDLRSSSREIAQASATVTANAAPGCQPEDGAASISLEESDEEPRRQTLALLERFAITEGDTSMTYHLNVVQTVPAIPTTRLIVLDRQLVAVFIPD